MSFRPPRKDYYYSSVVVEIHPTQPSNQRLQSHVAYQANYSADRVGSLELE